MTSPIEFTPEAKAEFDEAFDWYAERSTSAAIEFANEVDAAISLITADPQRHFRTYVGCQLCRLRRYPYCVVYHHAGDIITVVAIAHAKRRPGYWRQRR